MKTTDRDWMDLAIPWAMVAMVVAVAVFAFVQSYTHVYYLGQTHHQSGASLRMLPLSVDWLMFAAGLTRLHLTRKGVKHKFPLSALGLGAIATLIANIAAGIIWGWQTAAVNAWAPVVLFVVVELGMILVKHAKAKPAVILPFRGEVSPEALAETRRRLTELSEPQASPEPSQDTEAIPKAVDSPQEPLAGWGQLGGLARDQAALAGDQERLTRDQGLTGIGLANGRK